MKGVDLLGRPAEPTTYVDVSAVLEEKAGMLTCHASQREWLRAHHGTDEYLDTMRRHAWMRGRQAAVEAAKAFVQHCGHAYPSDDLLAELFNPNVARARRRHPRP